MPEFVQHTFPSVKVELVAPAMIAPLNRHWKVANRLANCPAEKVVEAPGTAVR
jgi:hypothetical protein